MGYDSRGRKQCSSIWKGVKKEKKSYIFFISNKNNYELLYLSSSNIILVCPEINVVFLESEDNLIECIESEIHLLKT